MGNWFKKNKSMNYNLAGGELEPQTKWEKDDSFWFSDKLEDWYGLKPKIRSYVQSKSVYDYKNPLNQGTEIKRSSYSSVDAGNYLGINSSSFIKQVKKLGIKQAFTGQKKYSHEQVLQVKKNLDKNRIGTSRSRLWNAEEIAKRWDLNLKDVKKVMTKKEVCYNAALLIANKLNK